MPENLVALCHARPDEQRTGPGESDDERCEEELKISIIRTRSPIAGPPEVGDNLSSHTLYAACLASAGMQATFTNSQALLSAGRLEASA